MNRTDPFIDIHCHLLPDLDDGPAAWEDSLAMAEMAAADGISAIVATPHQLGNYPQNTAENIRAQVDRLRRLLAKRNVNLKIFPGADVRIDPDLPALIERGEVLTLADRRRHVLLELPHEIYIPLDGLLTQLQSMGVTGVLSHPERNQGILNQPDIVNKLVGHGCLLQVTADSLTGGFGTRIQNFAEYMVRQGFADFIASDAHGVKSRLPLLGQAFGRAAELTDYDSAVAMFCRNPACLVAGLPVAHGKGPYRKKKSFSENHFFKTAMQFVGF
jgi:protein-tyrosine phosphatase